MPTTPHPGRGAVDDADSGCDVARSGGVMIVSSRSVLSCLRATKTRSCELWRGAATLEPWANRRGSRH